MDHEEQRLRLLREGPFDTPCPNCAGRSAFFFQVIQGRAILETAFQCARCFRDTHPNLGVKAA